MKAIELDPQTGDLLIEPKRINGIITQGVVISPDIDPTLIEMVLKAAPGEYKEMPLIGANVQMIQNGTLDPFWSAEVKRQLASVGVQVNAVRVVDNNIIIER